MNGRMNEETLLEREQSLIAAESAAVRARNPKFMLCVADTVKQENLLASGGNVVAVQWDESENGAGENDADQ